MVFSMLAISGVPIKNWLERRALASIILLLIMACDVQAEGIFHNEKFTDQDAILVTEEDGDVVFQWQVNRPLVPASLSKLLTAYLALDKWGEDHRFATDFYVLGGQLWIKGYGDPFLISEEIDVMASKLQGVLSEDVQSVHIDATYFAREAVPGRSSVSDPYNAPLSAVAANFNTVKLRRINGAVQSAELQTPLTSTAIELAALPANVIGRKASRVNLLNADRAQKHFAEILLAKLASVKSNALKRTGREIPIKINQSVPAEAELVYRHLNTNSLSHILRGTLEFSNNFIANQLYLLFAEGRNDVMTFARAGEYAANKIKNDFAWTAQAKVYDGAGLSRKNNLSATQVNQLLRDLSNKKTLLKKYPLKTSDAENPDGVFAYAKSGTLDGVHNLAGYLQLAERTYQFVFIFNRRMNYRYREDLLQKLADQLAQSLEA